MPPGPFISSNPNVVAVLDAISFPILFDMSKVEKRNVLDGTYMPTTSFTGGFRVCAFLDPSEPNHAILKSFFLSVLSSRHHKFIPLFRNSLSDLFINLEKGVSEKGAADFNSLNENMAFDFVFRLFGDENTSTETKVLSKGSTMFTKWLFFQLAPIMTLGLPKIFNLLEDLAIHTFPITSLFVKSDYKKLYNAFYTSATSILDQAESLGIKRDEACHNLVFLAGFNAYGGMKAWFPIMMKWVGSAGEKLHDQLAHEIRTVVKEGGGDVSLNTLDKMTLTKSVVYEALRIDPPVAFQYGKAKEDLVVRSHDSSFEIKKGEMIFGYQPFATKDPKVFENPEEFVGGRFVGEGEKLLKYVYWSNGRETEEPTAENKQCPAKFLVVLLSRVMLVEFFLRYDTFTVQTESLPVGSSVTFKSLTKATTT